MKISSSFDKQDRIIPIQSFKGIPETPIYMPNIVGKLGKVVGEYVNTPEQKLFLATTALMFQPMIDLKFADDEKKTDAAIKSASKAMAGGFTGVLIRALFSNITKHFIGFNKHNFLNRHFFPDDAIIMRESSNAMANIRMKQYCNTLGTLFAVVFMILFSNSKIDVPFTSDLQDIISGIAKENKSWPKSIHDVLNARTDKIKTWFTRKKDSILNIENKIKKVLKALSEDVPENKATEEHKT